MTPERAREIAEAGTTHAMPVTDWAVAVILAACKEERRAALTEAAEVCEKSAETYAFDMPDSDMANGARSCGWDILALRDKETKT